MSMLPSYGVHSVGGYAPMALDAAAASTGQSFLEGELELRDPKLNEPLTSVTWMRDIFAKTGGGYSEFTSNYFVDYATAGANQWGIINGQTNVIPTVQANITKDTFPVFTWANNIRVPFIDQQKMRQIGRSLDEIYDEGLRLNYQKAIDQNVYLGFSNYGSYGLVNNPNVTSSLSAQGASTHYTWATKTNQEIMNDVNNAIQNTWANSQYDLTGMANHILIPPANWALINNLPNSINSVGGFDSVLTYLYRNNIATAAGRQLEILPCRQCLGVGVPLTSGGAATNRLVAYVNAENRVMFDLPVPLSRAMTMADVNQLAYLTAYVGQMGVTKFKYFQPALYYDGI